MTSSAKARQFAKTLIARVLGAVLPVVPQWIPLGPRITSLAAKSGIDVRLYRMGTLEMPVKGLKTPRPGDTLSFAKGLPPAPSGKAEITTTIVMLAFNKAEFTAACLRSVIDAVDLRCVDIVVVDNASTDATPQMLESFGERIRVVRNESNLGFVEGCNVGAAGAVGRYLLFLNNDTIVTPGWLDKLVETADSDKSIGIVGPAFLYPDGRIQEAGGIVWNDGSAEHFGWGKSPDALAFALLRDVDYVSGASLLIRRELFEDIGGFDMRFAPGYYEDVDLCFSARARGYRVVFQPQSRVVHFEGISSGTDLSAGMKRFQVINRHKFVEKWKSALETQHLPCGSSRLAEAANRRRAEPVYLVFDEKTPTPDKDAGSLRMMHILRVLSSLGRTVFIPLSRSADDSYDRALLSEGIETAGVAFWRRYARTDVAAVVLSRPAVAETLMSGILKQLPDVPIIYDMVDAHFVRLERERKLNQNVSTAEIETMRQLEIDAARRAHSVWAASQADADALMAFVPDLQSVVIPTIHTLKPRGVAAATRHGMLFVGNMAHRPNHDGICHFLREVLPLIRSEVPEIELDIAGPGIDDAVRSLCRGEMVRPLGFVPDLQPLLDRARVFVAPLRFGAGVKGKIGEAMSCGLPVVTTSVGAEGLGLTDGKNVLIRDDDAGFAEAVTSLVRDDSLWQRISDGCYEHVRQTLTPEVIRHRIAHSIKASSEHE